MITQTWKVKFWNQAVNLYVIAGKDGLIFDSGGGGKVQADYLSDQIHAIKNLMHERGVDFNPARVLLSHGHYDHFSGMSFLRDTFGVKLWVTQQMVASITSEKEYRKKYQLSKDNFKDRSLSIKLIKGMKNSLEGLFYMKLLTCDAKFVKGPFEIINENSEITINGETWEIIPIPGHSPDHLAIYNPQSGVLLAGDLLFKSVDTFLGPPESDLDAYLNSLQTIYDLPNLKLILSAHGNPIDNPHKRIRSTIEHRRSQVEKVLNSVKASGAKGISFRQIVKLLYPERRDRPFLASAEVKVILAYLQNKEQLHQKIIGNRIVYTL